MDFNPSPAQQLLVSTAREVLRKHCPPELVQRLALEPRGFDAALWRAMAELGWPGLLIPIELGGSGGSLLDVVLLCEEMGRAALAGPFVASAVVATTLIQGAGTPAQQKRLLPALASGERILALAYIEDGGSADPDAVRLTPDGRGRLTGRKLFVTDAHLADELIVVVRAARDLGLVLLPTDRPGVTRTPLESIGGERLFEVAFDGVAVGPGDRLGAGHEREHLAAALRAGALARTAEMVGAAQRAHEASLEHAKARVQGGRPIGGYQAIQHACADNVRDVDAARGLLHAAAWAEEQAPPATADVAMAKAYGAEACLAVARRAHQIFGAIGYCEEHLLHLLHKRILAASVDCGETAHHLETVARAIGLG